MKCKHDTLNVISFGWDDIGNRQVTSYECRRCDAWLSLGRAKSAPRDEMRLAEMIAYWMCKFPDHPASLLSLEVDGFASGLGGWDCNDGDHDATRSHSDEHGED